MTSQLLANAAGVITILLALFAAPLLLGSYVIVQRTGVVTHVVWFGGVLMLLMGAVVFGAAGLVLSS
jgi:hypothetical protein